MNGRFGVYCGRELIDGREFFDDDAADQYRRDLLQEDLPEHLRSPLYDAHQLKVREITFDDTQRVQALQVLVTSGKKDS